MNSMSKTCFKHLSNKKCNHKNKELRGKSNHFKVNIAGKNNAMCTS